MHLTEELDPTPSKHNKNKCRKRYTVKKKTMAKHPFWNDDYWLLLLQLYQKKPMGVKPLYSKGMVDLSLELHIPPTFLHTQMFKLRMLTAPVQRLWDTYGKHPVKLEKAISRLRRMEGYGNAKAFYEGVTLNETFEKDWKPLKSEASLTPVKLTLILELYFQLTPITMVAETPEVVELAKLTGITPDLVVRVLELYTSCDPYLHKKETPDDPLLGDCQEVWQRYGNGNPDKLYQYASDLKEYFK